MSPLVSGTAPDSTLISVDLPAPLSPRRPTISRSLTLKVDVLERLDAAIGLLMFSMRMRARPWSQVPAWWRRSSHECSAIMPRMIAPMKML